MLRTRIPNITIGSLVSYCLYIVPLQWRHNEHIERDDVSNYRRLDCLLNRLFRCRSKKTSKLRVTGLCEGNAPVTVRFPAQRAVTRKMFPLDDVRYHAFFILFVVVVCLKSLYHHILSVACYSSRESRVWFPLLCGLWFVQIIEDTMAWMSYSSSPYHYHTDLFKRVERLKCLPGIFCRTCVHFPSYFVLLYTGGCALSAYPFLFWWLWAYLCLSPNRKYDALPYV